MKHFFAFLVAALMLGSVAFADGPTNEELAAQLQKLQQVIDQQGARIQELEGQLDIATPSNDTLRALVRAELAANPATRADWLDRLMFDAELGLRYEYLRGSNGRGYRESDEHRNDFQYFLTFGVESEIAEGLTARLELASGIDEESGPYVEGDPTTHYNTMGDAFLKDSIFINQAFLKYRAAGFTVHAGKHPNNWDAVMSELIWDPDVTPEGFQLRYDMANQDQSMMTWAQAEYLILEENYGSGSSEDPDIDALAFQLGSKFKMGTGMDLMLAGSLYCFDDVGALDSTFLRRNSSSVSDFDLWEVAGEFGFSVNEMPCALFGDFVRNSDSSADDHDTAWKAGLRVGKVAQKGDWAAQYDYSYVEQDAIASFFGEDIRGWSNYRGHCLGVDYGLLDNTVLSAKVFCLDLVHGADIVGEERSADHDNYVKAQLDVTVKF